MAVLSCALEDTTILPYDGKLHLDVLTFFQETLSTKTNHRYWSHTQQHRVSEITTCNGLMFQWSSVAVWDDSLRELTHDRLRELATLCWSCISLQCTCYFYSPLLEISAFHQLPQQNSLLSMFSAWKEVQMHVVTFSKISRWYSSFSRVLSMDNQSKLYAWSTTGWKLTATAWMQVLFKPGSFQASFSNIII